MRWGFVGVRTAKTLCVQRGDAFSSGDVCSGEVPALGRGQPGWIGKGRELFKLGELSTGRHTKISLPPQNPVNVVALHCGFIVHLLY